MENRPKFVAIILSRDIMYDYLVVGAGLFGCVFANKAKNAGKKCLVIDKRQHIGGNCYTEDNDGIHVHKYGAHIFRTSNRYVWDWLNKFCEFNNFINTPIAISEDKAYNLPFNINTFTELWGVKTPEEAKKIIEYQKKEIINEPKNLEEKAISLVGKDIYEKFIKGYTEKQWGKKCTELPASIIRRIPVRYTYNNNYFNDKYQGIPVGGYTNLFEKMLEGITVSLNTDFFSNREYYSSIAKKIIFTGPIDQYFDYSLGELEYRGLNFKEVRVSSPNVQGVAVFNYVDRDIPYTRSIEHKHFDNSSQDFSIISYEYPSEWRRGDTPFYPINDIKNDKLYERYAKLAEKEGNIIFCGRLGEYKYYDMQDTILSALRLIATELSFEAAINY